MGSLPAADHFVQQRPRPGVAEFRERRPPHRLRLGAKTSIPARGEEECQRHHEIGSGERERGADPAEPWGEFEKRRRVAEREREQEKTQGRRDQRSLAQPDTKQKPETQALRRQRDTREPECPPHLSAQDGR